jgi:hypothetical protein
VEGLVRLGHLPVSPHLPYINAYQVECDVAETEGKARLRQPTPSERASERGPRFEAGCRKGERRGKERGAKRAKASCAVGIAGGESAPEKP